MASVNEVFMQLTDYWYFNPRILERSLSLRYDKTQLKKIKSLR